jgi:phytoene dehydrogenase-like protein
MPTPSNLPTAHTKRRSKTPVPDQVDIAIVGAGTAGLCAGAYLAKQGLQVALFDSHYIAGGCATQFSRGPTRSPYLFDIGLHYIGECHPGGQAHGLLDPIGVELEYVPLDPEGFDTLVFPDFSFRIPADVDLYRQRLLDLFPNERKGIDRYLKLMRHMSTVFPRVMANDMRVNLRTLLYVAFNGQFVARYDRSTIGSFLDSCIKDPKLKGVILGQHGDYGLPPSEVAALMHVGMAHHYFQGAYYPKGGGQIMADKLAAAVEGYGGTIHLRRGIEKVVIEGGRAVGVQTESKRNSPSQQVRAKVVISTADYIQTMNRLVGRDHLSRKQVRAVERMGTPEAIFMTFMAVKGDLRDYGMSNSNYWQSDHYDIDEYYNRLRAPGELKAQGVYITSASLKDPDTLHAPEGHMTVEGMSLFPANPEQWGTTEEQLRDGTYSKSPGYQAVKQRLEVELLERVDQLFPGLTENIVHLESATPLTQTRYTRATGGTGYGISSTPELLGERRPGFIGPVPGMFMAGISTRAGNGVIGALAGGRIVARKVAAALGRPFS